MERSATIGATKVKLWVKDIEEAAYIQMNNLAHFPHIHPHLAFMPDMHAGYGIPIGSVIPSKDVVIPSAVGVDIGCGMLACRTNFKQIKEKRLKKIATQLKSDLQDESYIYTSEEEEKELPALKEGMKIIKKNMRLAYKQLGTLGGGNHFVEVQKGEDGFIWIMLHSGSRNLGKQVADYYGLKAEDYTKKLLGDDKKASKIAFLPLDHPDAKAYLLEMNFCIEYARLNRELLLSRVKQSFEKVMGGATFFDSPIDLPHNFASLETYKGEEIIVHRKGAAKVPENELGIIPGSMGTASYLVKGKGNEESFFSCSHGAGRKMGRNDARRKLDLDYEKKRLDQQRIVHFIKIKDDLEEATGAYKNIDKVMALQRDLVDVMMEMKPLAVVKM